ncbi:oligosaccharide flippase family protein [Congregibacter brevis]|uniref:Oligosaccharide flippase family protein n=1 Tax=Congregibacter brevis TaxID=3081201 RepID=A0ABZ0ICX2_9GAMM|nr:oligosaccharide flippase family protein [Congregibacter sp. IMCC45268]
MTPSIKAVLSSLLPKSSFARGVSVLAGGAVTAQALTVLASPVLSRLYTPDHFGLLAVFTAVLTIIAALATLRYELAIPLADDDVVAANLLVLCIAILAGVTVVVTLLVYSSGPVLTHKLNVPLLEPYLWLVPVGVLCIGGYNIFHYWGVRSKLFQTIAFARVGQSFATLIIQILGYKYGGAVLLIGQAVGQGVGLSRLGVSALSSSALRSVSWSGVCSSAHRYRRFPVYTTWAGLVNIVGQHLPILVFAAFFSSAAAGLYLIANRLLVLPTSLLGGAIGNVLLAHSGTSDRRVELPKTYSGVQHKLIQVGLPPALVLMLIGPDLMELVLGADWRDAGILVRWLALGAFAGFVIAPLSVVMAILEQQAKGLLLQVNLFALRSIAIGIGVYLSDLYVAVAAFSVASVLGYASYAVVMSKLLNLSMASQIKSLLESAWYAVLSVIPLLIYSLYSAQLGRVEFLFAVVSAGCLVIVRWVFVAKMAS